MKRLRLRHEALAELTPDEIRGVVGGHSHMTCITDCLKLTCGCFPVTFVTCTCDQTIQTCYPTCTCFC